MRPLIDTITRREIQVLKLLANDYTSRELAQELFISLETVYSHRKCLNHKLGVKTTGDLIGKNFEMELLNPIKNEN